MKSHPRDAIYWDCFMAAGTKGVFSQRFVDVVGKDSLSAFTLLARLLCRATVLCQVGSNLPYCAGFPNIVDCRIGFLNRPVMQKRRTECNSARRPV
jgi:hypothetical protein